MTLRVRDIVVTTSSATKERCLQARFRVADHSFLLDSQRKRWRIDTQRVNLIRPRVPLYQQDGQALQREWFAIQFLPPNRVAARETQNLASHVAACLQ